MAPLKYLEKSIHVLRLGLSHILQNELCTTKNIVYFIGK